MDQKDPPPPPYSEAVCGQNNFGFNAGPGDFYGNAPPPASSPPGAYYSYGQPPPPQQQPHMMMGSYPPQQSMMHNNVTVVNQQPRAVNEMVHEVPDNMGLAIFATICCFWPVGIVAIMRASEARSALMRNDLASAQASASDARRLSFIAMVIGAIMLITVIIIVVVVVNNANTYYR